jgi:undecaprenyl-phosphate galactose phosphotransferase/putative colanic acid biosynthesis UDP-glucose lipid carrier transferase
VGITVSEGRHANIEAAAIDAPPLIASDSTLSPSFKASNDNATSHGRVPFNLVEPAVVAGDFVVIALAGLLAATGYQWLFLGTFGNVETYFAVSTLVFANFVAITSAQENYRVANLINLGRQLRYVTLNWLFICFMLLGVAFALKISESFSRGSTLSFFAVGWLGLVAARTLTARYVKRSLTQGAFAEKKVILITEASQLNSSHVLNDATKCGYSVAHTFEITKTEFSAPGIAKSLRKKIEQVVELSRADDIDQIFLLVNWSQRKFIDEMVHLLRVVPIPIQLLPDDNTTRLFRNRTIELGTAWTVELQRAPLSAAERLFKRACDIAGAAAGLVLLSPLMLMTALLIKLDSPGPVFFKQKRSGFNDRTFLIYKFRTMRVLEDGDVIRQAKRNDPRVTRIGRFLRSSSIDELPQLFNVLSGHMSLVGPRPHAIAHNNEYQKIIANYAFRHHVKPGITGWAQISGFRGETRTVDMMAKRVEHDLWYINHWSPWLDTRIVLKTLLLAYRQPTAY